MWRQRSAQRKTQPTKTSNKPTINAPRWSRCDSSTVRLIGWVSEVRQIALKEEGIDLVVMPDD